MLPGCVILKVPTADSEGIGSEGCYEKVDETVQLGGKRREEPSRLGLHTLQIRFREFVNLPRVPRHIYQTKRAETPPECSFWHPFQRLCFGAEPRC